MTDTITWIKGRGYLVEGEGKPSHVGEPIVSQICSNKERTQFWLDDGRPYANKTVVTISADRLSAVMRKA